MSTDQQTVPPGSTSPEPDRDSYAKPIRKTRRQWNLSALRTGLVLAVIAGCMLFVGAFNATRLATGIPDLIDITTEMFPPNFSRTPAWIMPLLDTLAMSVAGTALAIAFSVPLAFLAAYNTTSHAVVYRTARAILNALRSIPELIMGIIFVAAVGFGALPGVLALGIHSIGMVGKFFAESIEHVDEAPVEAVRATGASSLQVVLHGVLPQVLPQMADVSIYRWEYNFRASTVLGLVGAGGIGFEILSALRVLDYQQVSALLLIILVMVTLVDAAGGLLRKRFK